MYTRFYVQETWRFHDTKSLAFQLIGCLILALLERCFSLFFLYLLLHNTCLSLEKCHVSFVTQIKLSSVQLARKYMKRVAYELDSISGSDKDPNREFLLLQGVRFAFRVHQVIKETLESNKNLRII